MSSQVTTASNNSVQLTQFVGTLAISFDIFVMMLSLNKKILATVIYDNFAEVDFK